MKFSLIIVVINNLLLVWSVATCCVQVAQFIQTLASTWLAYSFNHHLSIPPLEIGANLPKCQYIATKKSQLSFVVFVVSFPKSILVVDHILSYLPMTPSML
jgi:hypothetical protein